MPGSRTLPGACMPHRRRGDCGRQRDGDLIWRVFRSAFREGSYEDFGFPTDRDRPEGGVSGPGGGRTCLWGIPEAARERMKKDACN